MVLTEYKRHKTKEEMSNKRYTGLILAIAATFFIGGINIPFQVKAKSKKAETGITLDCARHYYSTDDLKEYIDLLGEKSDSFLQLHFTDNENVGIECDNLGQTQERAARKSDGSYVNKITGKKFLSNEQIKELLTYAKDKKVEIIPEIDAPAHMDGFFALAKNYKGRGFLKKIKKSGYDGELDLENKAAVSFVKSLYSEYAELFSGCRYFHMGCDEMESGSNADKISYITDISQWLRQEGYTVRIWNDMITRKNIDKLPDGIQVTYWSYDGDTEDKDEKKERRRERASLTDLTNAGIPVLNYNSYYLYYVPNVKDTKKDKAYMVNDIRENWNQLVWDQERSPHLKNTKYIIGASISVWGEDAKKINNKDIFDQTRLLYQAMKNAAQ